ncbi:uncharacterized protein LOC142771676 [Rhipicephalus microplus]|uniref:uncharacterized protein LOC142771676 n=1 Tax=Rhipicephalus microplus TaxID=6941 RepID=UPI003F6C7CE8
MHPWDAPSLLREDLSTLMVESVGDDVISARTGSSSQAVVKALADGSATTTTHDYAVKQLGKSSDITKYKNLTSTAPATQGAGAHDSTGIARTITDPEMAAFRGQQQRHSLWSRQLRRLSA